MNLVSVDYPVPVFGGATMMPGERYWLTSQTSGMMLQDTQLIPCPDGKSRSLLSMTHVNEAFDIPIQPRRSMNGHTVYLWRYGGHGDCLFMGPTIRALKTKWPRCRVVVVCGDEYKIAFDGVNCEVMSSPIPQSIVEPGDAVYFYENLIEHNPEAEHIHAVDLFAQKIGITLDSRRLEWHVSPLEAIEALRRYPRTQSLRIGVQVAASSPVRSYHPSLLSTVCATLASMGHEVFMFGKPGQMKVDLPGCTNLANDGLGMRESVAVLQTCDVALTPDSSLFHVAQALSIPTVAIFGSFPSALRVTNPDFCTVLEPKGGCSPCFFHSSQNIVFPPNRPCTHAKFCTVIASITPEQVIDSVVELLGRQKHPAID
jgi:ADP-heptose:LPS heptosyltransferase